MSTEFKFKAIEIKEPMKMDEGVHHERGMLGT